MVAQASVAHDVQTITMALQPAASRLTQRITFTAIDCPTGTNCMTDAFYNTSMYSPPSTPHSYHDDAIPWSIGLGAPINAPGRCAGWCHNNDSPWSEKCGWWGGECSTCSQCFDNQPCLSECDGHAGFCPAAC